VRRVRRSSSSLSGESEIVSNTTQTQNDAQKGDNVDVKRKRIQLARPAVLDLERDFGFSQKQKIVLDNLKERLEAANKLHGEAVDLQTLYESGTVATMKDFRATGKVVPFYLQSQYTET
jgi:hypothetical protein